VAGAVGEHCAAVVELEPLAAAGRSMRAPDHQ
jgi:hypothetical protein